MPHRSSRRAVAILAIGSALALAGCAGTYRPSGPPLAGSTPQNWGAKQQIDWYRGSQGSRLIPAAWLRALEAPDTTTLFMDPANFDRFNYLPAATGEPSTLPIGFAVDRQSDKGLPVTGLRWYKGQDGRQPWIGLNCAACHTGAVSYGGTSYRVDGAPTLADFQGFTDTLLKSMQQTAGDPAKWARFADRVVTPRRKGERNDDRVNGDRAMLKAAFAALLGHMNELAAYNATDSEYGHGRLDAVGHILNKVAWLNGDPQQFRGEPDAPVSYPFVWNAGQHDYVQWNALVPSKSFKIGATPLQVGALIRNTGEVIGVFADVKTTVNPGLKGYRSSVMAKNMVGLEDRLGNLWSPAWPAEFGVPDPGAVEAGRRLFETEFEPGNSCASCHKPLKRDDTTTPIIAQMSPVWGPRAVGTDPWMMCNTYVYQARGGLLTGTRVAVFDGPPQPGVGQTQNYLQTQIIGSLLSRKRELLEVAIRKAVGLGVPVEVFTEEAGVEKQGPRNQPLTREQRLEQCKQKTATPPDANAARMLGYKARPLNGIWATAPYLHNGSVKSLYELLLPPARRSPQFWVGNREFDVKNVGFVDTPGKYGSWFRANTGKGNSNAGHDYGNARLTDEQRYLLIAYMKTL